MKPRRLWERALVAAFDQLIKLTRNPPVDPLAKVTTREMRINRRNKYRWAYRECKQAPEDALDYGRLNKLSQNSNHNNVMRSFQRYGKLPSPIPKVTK